MGDGRGACQRGQVLNMFCYMDDKLSIADDMLISYAASSRYALVPGEVDGHPVRRIGEGAFSGDHLLRAEIGEGIRYAKGAFDGCRNLRELTLPASMETTGVMGVTVQPVITRLWRNLQKSEYDMLAGGIPLSGGMRVVTADPMFCPSMLAVRSLFQSGCAIAYGITPAQTALFYAGGLIAARETFRAGGLMQIALSPGYEGLTEMDTVRTMIAKGNMGFTDAREEALADSFARMDKERAITRTSVMFIRDRDAQMIDDGSVRAQLICRRGYFFFPSLCCVVNRGKEYYIYRRNYMTEGHGYIRMDVCVMHADGMETDSRIVEEVYGKYRLLSLL